MEDHYYDYYFTEQSMDNMMTVLSGYYPEFDKDTFKKLVFDPPWSSLHIMKKIRHVALCLHKVMPDSFEETVDILVKATPEIGWWESVTFPDYVAVYGQDSWDISMAALTEFTKHSSSEFAIRPFLRKEPKKTAAFLLKLAGHENENVRRFATEGCRPSHPWGIGLPMFKKDPSLILPILEKLKNDGSEFVRRSVANNLNAISKDHPDTVLAIAERWYGNTPNTDSLLKHACRTLLKKGDRRAMELFGLGNTKNLEVTDVKLDKESIVPGERISFSYSLEVKGEKEILVRLEFGIHCLKGNGSFGRKVYKIAEKPYQPGLYKISKRTNHFIDRTTRKLYGGTQSISIIVNGEEKGKLEFMLNK